MSTSISNILDLELLTNVMIDLISKTLKIRGGHLFVVDREDEEHAEGAYRLREVGSPAKTDPNRGMLTPTSPIAGHLCQEEHPLTQYDIDLLARFQAISSEEHAWLSALAVDVYVPIHAKGEWIGMLALGPKLSGDRYFQEDLVLLRTLADQTAVALENARLVEGLIRANDDLGQAYAALAEASRQLQELDKLKSAFILHVDVPEELPALTGDRERLGDAVYHLVHNAIKFTEAGGEV